MSEASPPAGAVPNPNPSPPAAASAATATAPPKPAPPAKAPPAKAPPGKAPDKGGTRRSFLVGVFGSWISIAWITFTASMVGMLLGTVRFLFPNVLSEPPSTFRAGNVNAYEED